MPNISNGLKVVLKPKKRPVKAGSDISISAVFENVSDRTYSITFWWAYLLRIKDSAGRLVKAGPGPEAPCGVKEEPTIMRPMDKYTKEIPLACTQPCGHKIKVGWSYDLRPGRYQLVMVYENPPAHGFSGNDAKDAWKGRVETEPIELIVV